MFARPHARKSLERPRAKSRRGATNVTTLLAIPILLTLVVGAVQMTRLLTESTWKISRNDEAPRPALEDARAVAPRLAQALP